MFQIFKTFKTIKSLNKKNRWDKIPGTIGWNRLPSLRSSILVKYVYKKAHFHNLKTQHPHLRDSVSNNFISSHINLQVTTNTFSCVHNQTAVTGRYHLQQVPPANSLTAALWATRTFQILFKGGPMGNM